jgi:hypothetical protein
VRISSTAPLGGGNSSRLNITSSGNILFGNTGCTLNFDNPNPNGEVVVSRINLHPDQEPNASNASRCYWIIDNYGSNNSFANLNGMDLNKVGGINANDAAHPNQFNLFKRNWNADGNTWSNAIDSATTANASTDGSLSFANAVPLNQSAQIVVTSRSSGSFVGENNLTASSTSFIKLYPSPVLSGGNIYLKNESSNEKSECTIYNADGKKLQHFIFEGIGMLNTSGFTAGNYFYQIKTETKIQNGIFVVLK